jgi:hypothetical protein
MSHFCLGTAHWADTSNSVQARRTKACAGKRNVKPSCVALWRLLPVRLSAPPSFFGRLILAEATLAAADQVPPCRLFGRRDPHGCDRVGSLRLGVPGQAIMGGARIGPLNELGAASCPLCGVALWGSLPTAEVDRGRSTPLRCCERPRRGALPRLARSAPPLYRGPSA